MPSKLRPRQNGGISLLTFILLALTTSTTFTLVAAKPSLRNSDVPATQAFAGSGQQILNARADPVKKACNECDICESFCKIYDGQAGGNQRIEACKDKCFTQCNSQVCASLDKSKKEWEAHDKSERERIEKENLEIARKEKEYLEKEEKDRKDREQKERERLEREEKERKEREQKDKERREREATERKKKEEQKKADDEKKRKEQKAALEEKSMKTFRAWMSSSLVNLEVDATTRIPKAASKSKKRSVKVVKKVKRSNVKRDEEADKKKKEEEEKKKKEEEEKKKKEEEEKKKIEADLKKKKEDLQNKLKAGVSDVKSVFNNGLSLPQLQNPFHNIGSKIPVFRDPAKLSNLTAEAQKTLKEYNDGRQDRIKKLKAEFDVQKKNALTLAKDLTDKAKKELVEKLKKDQAADMKKFKEVEKGLKDVAMKIAFGADKWEQMKKDRKAKFEKFKADNKAKFEKFKADNKAKFDKLKLEGGAAWEKWEKFVNGTMSKMDHKKNGVKGGWGDFKKGGYETMDDGKTKWLEIKTGTNNKVDGLVDKVDKKLGGVVPDAANKWSQFKSSTESKWNMLADDVNTGTEEFKIQIEKPLIARGEKAARARRRALTYKEAN
ncbi:hypothetical protein DFH27DRAFT_598154 [Peziza echinospora]|nr:hypothetical protein DFH27DRAFT_598154 [Peziza echinospora]